MKPQRDYLYNNFEHFTEESLALKNCGYVPLLLSRDHYWFKKSNDSSVKCSITYERRNEMNNEILKSSVNVVDFNPDDRPLEDFAHPISSTSTFIAYLALLLLDYAEGIDTSHWRPNPPMAEAKEAGIDFWITKCTEGTSFFDDTYLSIKDKALVNGFSFAGFHYWKAASGAIAQAKYFCDHLGEGNELLDVIDFEKYGNEGVLSPVNAAQNLFDTAEEIRQRRGRDVMLYTNKDSYQVLTNNSPIISTFKHLWVASWTTASQPVLPVGATEWEMWQYTNAYKIPGFSTLYDGNRFNGTDADFQNYVKAISGGDPVEHEHTDLQDQINALIERINILEQGHNKQHRRIKSLEVQIPEIVGRLDSVEAKLAAIGEILKGV